MKSEELINEIKEAMAPNPKLVCIAFILFVILIAIGIIGVL